MNDLELKVLALGEAHRRMRDGNEFGSTNASPEFIADLLIEMHKAASAMRDMVRMELGLCTDLERKLNHWIFPLALWEREREAREDAQREARLEAMYSSLNTAQADMRDHMASRLRSAEKSCVNDVKTKIGNSEPYYGNMDAAECVDQIPETESAIGAKLDLVVTMNGVPFRDQSLGIQMFKDACDAEIRREMEG